MMAVINRTRCEHTVRNQQTTNKQSTSARTRVKLELELNRYDDLLELLN